MRVNERILPGGDVTFVFTDIEGSTRLLRELGDERYAELLERHDELLRICWDRHRGIEVGNEGDSFFVVFTQPSDAVLACTEAQLALASESWGPGGQIRVRMGIHSGIAQPRNSDYASLTVHQAARVMSAASGAQVFMTKQVAARIDDDDGYSVNVIGRYRIRDFDGPVELFELRDDRWPAAHFSPRVPPADTHNLIRPRTSLIGRQEELENVPELVGSGVLTSLVGPGGVGKTRLAIEVGLACAARWSDGVWMAELDRATTLETMVGSVARALGLRLDLGADPMDELLDRCSQRSSLLILDNCEHLLGMCAQLASGLLHRAPSMGVLATSRTPLGLVAERVWRLGPLDTSPTTGPTGSTPDAIRLFRDRIELGRSTVGSSSSDDEIGRICAQLDGIPLAIELVAANAHRMPLSEISAALDDHVSFPEVRDPTVPERHRSLDNVLEWSHVLLDDDGRALLSSVCDLPAGFDIETAHAAVGGLGQQQLGRTMRATWSLVDNSLIEPDSSSGGRRYRCSSLVRNFAVTRTDTASRSVCTARLIDHYLRTLGPHRTPDQAWASLLGEELDNLRHLTMIGSSAPIEDRQALAWTIGRYLDMTDQFAFAIAELDSFARHLSDPTPELVAIRSLIADIHLRRGDLECAEAEIAVAERLLAQVGPVEWDDVCVPRTRGDIALRQGNTDLALRIALDALETSPSPRGAARVWDLIGIIHATADDPVEAAIAFRRELELWREVGSFAPQATTLGNLAEVALRAGDERAAAEYQLGCLDIAMELGQPVLSAFSIVVAAQLAALRQRWPDAVRLQSAADHALESIGYVMYDSDKVQRRQMLNEAAKELTEAEVARLRDAGADLDLGTASTEASAFLRSLIRNGVAHE